MTRLGRIIFGEGPHFPTMSLRSFSGKKPQRAMTRGRKLSMRLQIRKEINDQRKSPVTRQKDGKQTQIREENCSYIPSSTRAATGRKGENTCWMMALSMRRTLQHQGGSFYLKHTKVCSCFRLLSCRDPSGRETTRGFQVCMKWTLKTLLHSPRPDTSGSGTGKFQGCSIRSERPHH